MNWRLGMTGVMENKQRQGFGHIGGAIPHLCQKQIPIPACPQQLTIQSMIGTLSDNQLTRRSCRCPVTRIALVTTLALGLWCQCLVAVAQQLTGAYRPSGPVVEVFGINEAISFPEKFERRGVKLEVLRRSLDQQGLAAVQVGARWTRGHTVAFPRLSWDRWEHESRSFARADLWLQAVQRAGLEAVMMIGPWPGNKSRDFTSHYVLQGSDRERYVEFVRAAVERYDGDGLNDMPGLLRGVRFWEVDNEPDLKNSGSPQASKRSNFCTPEQFAEIVILTARTIKSADPGARVLNGGLYRVTKEFGYRYLRDLLAVPGLLAAIDILSVHAYHTGRDAGAVELTLRRVQEVARGKPVWLTETSVPAAGKESFLSPEWQAEILARTVILALAYGIERVFWHTLYDPPTEKGGERKQISAFATNSLYRKAARQAPLEIKPAGKTYRKLTQILKGIDWRDIRPIKVDRGIGVALGNGRWLVYSDSSTFRTGVPASQAQTLLDGREVAIRQRGGKIEVNGQRQALLLTGGS